MGVIGWVLLGLIAGAIAKALHSGNEPGGILGTMAGALLLLAIYNAITTAGAGRGGTARGA